MEKIEQETLDLRKLLLLRINEVIVVGPVSPAHTPSGFVIDLRGERYSIFDLDTDVRAYSNTPFLEKEEDLVALKEKIVTQEIDGVREGWLRGREADEQKATALGLTPITGSSEGDNNSELEDESLDSDTGLQNVPDGETFIDSPSIDLDNPQYLAGIGDRVSGVSELSDNETKTDDQPAIVRE